MVTDERTETHTPDPEIEQGRVLGALSYVPFLCFLPAIFGGKNRFALFHARQGTVLFFIEIVVCLALSILSHTIGLIPVIGFIVLLPIRLILLLGILIAAVAGFVKAISGEYWQMPVIGEHTRKVPF
ncbi:MAG: hypothetical protein QME66_10640 [Candidatus Eisenbacteria bacterium]|nr:hypothetical protein [Candidatus Eisenbacteria bacterium]